MANNETIEELAVKVFEARRKIVNGEEILRHVLNIFNLSEEVWQIKLVFSSQEKSLKVRVSFKRQGEEFLNLKEDISKEEPIIKEIDAISKLKVDERICKSICEYIYTHKALSCRFKAELLPYKPSITIKMKDPLDEDTICNEEEPKE